MKDALPRILANVPPELKVTALADQSVFVRASIEGVVREALIAAGLTGLMILLFLGSWRSTLIVCISIPLSILTSLFMLSLLGQTINVMTLGGLALAVGILVDDATVEIENTHRNLAMRKPLIQAVLDGASQIAVPTFVATLSHLHRVRPGAAADRNGAISVHAAGDGGCLRHARFLSAVAHAGADDDGVPAARRGAPLPAGREASRRRKGCSGAPTIVFNALFETLRYRYMGLLDWSLRHRGRVLHGFMAFSVGVARAGRAGRRGLLSRTSIPARCGFMRAVRPARASKRPKRASPRSSAKSAA